MRGLCKWVERWAGEELEARGSPGDNATWETLPSAILEAFWLPCLMLVLHVTLQVARTVYLSAEAAEAEADRDSVRPRLVQGDKTSYPHPMTPEVAAAIRTFRSDHFE